MGYASHSGFGDLRSELEAFLIDHELSDRTGGADRRQTSNLRLDVRSISIDDNSQLLKLEADICSQIGASYLAEWRNREAAGVAC